MASITIRNLDDDLKSRLRIEAAIHHRSMEEQARVILRTALNHPAGQRGLGSRIRARLGTDAMDLELPDRNEMPRGADIQE
jgi:plasmid stability protein